MLSPVVRMNDGLQDFTKVDTAVEWGFIDPKSPITPSVSILIEWLLFLHLKN